MNQTYEIIRGTIILVVVLAIVGWVMFRWLKRSKDDPGWLITKWVITVMLIIIMAFAVRFAGIGGLFIIVACAVILSIIWTPNIGALMAKPLTSMFDGGDEEPEPRPIYSIARAQLLKGKYAEALAEVRKQLDKFPYDLEGTLLLAKLQAVHLNDLPGAAVTVERWCDQPVHPPLQIAAALNQLADWHLKLAQDREAARLALEKIQFLFPDTEMALQSAQRIAHLGDAEMLLSPHDRKRSAVPEGVKNLGLLKDQSHLVPAASDPEERATGYVKHLEEHPQDSEAREKLALIYADHYQRLDLATDQLEQLIQQPDQPAKQVVHWLNLLADLQIKHANDQAAARQSLQRIIDQYSGLAAAENAQRRLDILKLELKGKEKSQAVTLGSYEQNIGLKRRP